MTHDDLPRDRLVEEALGRYMAPVHGPDDWAAITARVAGRRRSRRIGVIVGGLAAAALSAGGLGVALSSRDSHHLSPAEEIRESQDAGGSAERVPGWPAPVVLGGASFKVVPSTQRADYVCVVADRPDGNATSCAPGAILQRDGVTRGFVNNVIGITDLWGVAPLGTHIRPVTGMLTDGRFFYMPSGAETVKSVTFVDDASGAVVKTVDLSR